MKTYTVEIYKPAYPQTGIHVRVHCGTFEENRDHLSPCMVETGEVQAERVSEAGVKAQEFLAQYIERIPWLHL